MSIILTRRPPMVIMARVRSIIIIVCLPLVPQIPMSYHWYNILIIRLIRFSVDCLLNEIKVYLQHKLFTMSQMCSFTGFLKQWLSQLMITWPQSRAWGMMSAGKLTQCEVKSGEPCTNVDEESSLQLSVVC